MVNEVGKARRAGGCYFRGRSVRSADCPRTSARFDFTRFDGERDLNSASQQLPSFCSAGQTGASVPTRFWRLRHWWCLRRSGDSLPKAKPPAGEACRNGFNASGTYFFAASALAASALPASLLAYLRRKRSTRPGGVHELLLAGKEGMAGGADFYADIALVGGAGNEGVAAGAMNANFAVMGMNGCFHDGS